MPADDFSIPDIETETAARGEKKLATPQSFFSDATIALMLHWFNRNQRPIASSLAAVETQRDAESRRVLFLQRWRRAVTPWMRGLRWHLLLLIIFAFLFTRAKPETALVLEFDPSLLSVLQNAHDVSLAPEPSETVTIPDPPVENPLVTPTTTEVETPDLNPTTLVTQKTQKLFFDGREIGGRDAILAAEGGNGSTEAAVELGLKWLQKNQLRGGNWSLQRPFRGGVATSDQDNQIAATALALLAFQGFGVTPQSKHPKLAQFVRNVEHGWTWLLPQQKENGLFFDDDIIPTSHRFYTHAMVTIALAERAAMTNNKESRDETLQEPLKCAVDYLLAQQNKLGGWKYEATPSIPESDLSVTGWVMMALKSAESCDIEIPRETWERISTFLDSVDRNGYYCYENSPRERPKLSMTAEGIFCRLLLAPLAPNKLEPHHLEKMNRGLVWITSENNLMSENSGERDVYSAYYATQATHFFGGEYWQTWNTAMRETLLSTQERTGTEVGSWSPVGDAWGATGGRLYTTTLAILMLESYYRYSRFP